MLCRYRHNIHWTMKETRLARNLGYKKWGDEGYAKEELVAELGSVFLSADLGIAIEPREDHAAYIASWLKILKNDKRAVFQMAAHAERAVTYLHGLQQTAEDAAATAGEPAMA
ncbi:zincin-like metallopeptidase domain-containing protein [Ensifer sp. NPDC090286]|uniref:zincin-like metallopeptidase domain-containing protein n=1 Tax=Ensifer sp. NPDC090286 TaxID=3363991 RepID=UPI00383AC664